MKTTNINKINKQETIKIVITIIISALALFIMSNKVDASDYGITSSAKEVYVGDSVTVTGTVTAGSWEVTLQGAGQNKKIVGYTDTTANKTATASITFTASEATTYTFTFTGNVTDYDTEQVENISKSLTITAKEKPVSNPEPAPSTSSTENNNQNSGSSNNQGSSNNSATTNQPVEEKKSSNANLRNLGIRPNDFSGFKANKTSYSVTVPNDVEKVEVYAVAQDDKSTIEGTGNKKLQVGKNSADVVVTAEDGTKKTYTINITREEEKVEETIQTTEVENTQPEAGSEIMPITAETPVSVQKGLKELNIDGITLTPEFSSDKYEYNTQLQGTEETLVIKIATISNTPTLRIKVNDLSSEKKLENNTATIELETSKTFTQNENVLEIELEEENGETTTYKITIINPNIEPVAASTDEQTGTWDIKDNLTFMFISFEAVVGVILLILIILLVRSFKKTSKKNRKNEEEMELPKIYREQTMQSENGKPKMNNRGENSNNAVQKPINEAISNAFQEPRNNTMQKPVQQGIDYTNQRPTQQGTNYTNQRPTQQETNYESQRQQYPRMNTQGQSTRNINAQRQQEMQRALDNFMKNDSNSKKDVNKGKGKHF